MNHRRLDVGAMGQSRAWRKRPRNVVARETMTRGAP